MIREVAIVGVGWSPFRSITPDLSYKEMMYEAAVRAYEDAGIDPRRDVDSFVTVAEDFNEGTSIFDEYVPDQLGALHRPVQTITGDGIHGIAAAVMQILTGQFDVVVVEAHSKASNVLTLPHILAYAMDPVFNRPLAAHPYFIAGMEMRRYLAETGTPLEACAQVVVKNRANALRNPLAGYGADLTIDDVLASEPIAEPLTRLACADHADGAVVMVLASGETARALTDRPIWVRGIGWANDTFWLESRPWGQARYAYLAGQMAYSTAGIKSPRTEIDFAEIDDTFAYKELQHLEALGLCKPGEAGAWTLEGGTELEGEFPVNPSGGSLGEGHLLDCTGLARVLEVVLQLRGEAGPRQIEDAEVGLAFAWRGVPTTSGAAVILSN
ncbi:MAG TPA: acetyl-CoA acetyltransferase [Thermoflexia bacterium]|jgi:acetyl-CoA C-acetyltransferase|nr:acetyl-CoA acetyltransferase [Thermoflexia bacterium]